MTMLTDEMKRIVDQHKVGFVATVCEDGTPNLSPKGTMLVLDDRHIIFGEIRSPGTLRNLRERPAMEINVLDVLARKALRAKGTAIFIEAGSQEFRSLRPRFDQWGELANRIRGIVKLKVGQAKIVTSPAYDLGQTEGELRAYWKAYLTEL